MARNISTKTTAERLAGLLNTYYAKKTDLPVKLSDLTNDSGFISETVINEKISAAVAGALIPAGSVAFASLPALSKANCNHIYNVTDAFTTTSDFVEGAGKSYPAGTNVAIINVGTSSTPSYKYDCYTGVIDLSGYMEKKAAATSGNFATFDANGQVVDSGTKPGDFLTEHQDISGKADKVEDATAGNFAALDADGNLVDSGKSPDDFIEDISGKADKKVPATNGNVATLDASGNLADGGKTVAQLTNVIEGVQVDGADLVPDGSKKVNVVISGKADKVTNATANNIAKLDANGNLADGGIAVADILVATDISDYTEAELKALLGITE